MDIVSWAEQHPQLAAALVPLVCLLIGGIGGTIGWWLRNRKPTSAKQSERMTLNTTTNTAVKSAFDLKDDVIDGLVADVKRLQSEMDQVRVEMSALKAKYTEATKENRAWREWADAVLAVLPQAILDKLPPRPAKYRANGNGNGRGIE